MRVDIVRQADDLHRETWIIQLSTDDHIDRLRMNLVEHSAEFLPSQRHRKWLLAAHWYRYLSQGKPYDQPIPEDVVQEAKDSFVAEIRAAAVGCG